MHATQLNHFLFLQIYLKSRVQDFDAATANDIHVSGINLDYFAACGYSFVSLVKSMVLAELSVF